ncbi:MAG: type II toxin-antitoxin system PemK/MazF family toxin [Desulfobacterales bacterium]
MVVPVQGDVYWLRFGRSGDSGPSGRRPAVVIQNDLLNRSNINTTIVSLITSNLKLAGVPGNVLLQKSVANLPKSSVVVVSQVATVDKLRLLEKMGTLPVNLVEEIVNGCRMVISLQIF